MKYLVLNDEVTSPDYGHYVSFSDETGEVKYEFRSSRIPLQALHGALIGIREITGSDRGIALYGKSGIPAYNTTYWNTLVGSLSAQVLAELQSKYPWVPGVTEIETPTGELLDAPHFWATMSGLFAGHGDLTGWAGDLVQFANDLKTDPEAEFPGGTFGWADWWADLDAHNIYYQISANADLTEASKAYWETVDEGLRCRAWITKGDVRSRFFNSSDLPLLRALITTSYPGVTDALLEAACSKMQAYLDQFK